LERRANARDRARGGANVHDKPEDVWEDYREIAVRDEAGELTSFQNTSLDTSEYDPSSVDLIKSFAKTDSGEKLNPKNDEKHPQKTSGSEQGSVFRRSPDRTGQLSSITDAGTEEHQKAPKKTSKDSSV